MKHNDCLLELVRIAIGNQKTLSHSPSPEEWWQIYDAANRQSLLGVCFEGVSMLNEAFRPDAGLFYQWLSMVAQIQEQNAHVDRQTAEMWRKLKDAGLQAAVLKGQGIAVLYDIRGKKVEGSKESLATLRQSGDIDIWVKGGYRKVCDFVQKTIPTDDVAYHRFHYDAFEDTEVELHHRPTLMRNLFDDRRLERWYDSFGADSFVYLEDKGFAVPSYEFNRIFILTHIYRHFLFEGVGLRQVMDYYFVLRNGRVLKEDAKEVIRTLRFLRLEKFAGAMMWVLKEKFGLEEDCLICEPDEKEGRFLLNELLMSGNFGQTDKRYQYKRLFKMQLLLFRGSHLLIHYPSEVIWSPIWIVYHWFWKRKKKMDIHKRWNQ